MKKIKKSLITYLVICIFLLRLNAAGETLGDGTQENPWQIENIEDLARIGSGEAHPDDSQDRGWKMDDYYELTCDIDAMPTGNPGSDYWNDGAGWEPIGDSDNVFSGTFHGNGYVISGLFINRATENNIGLFGRTSSNASIESVEVLDAVVTGANDTGIIAGYNSGEIKECLSSGWVDGSGASLVRRIGGLAGRNTSSGVISDSSSSAAVNGGHNNFHIGGLVGANDGKVKDSRAFGDVYVSRRPGGGLVGTNSGVISRSYATGNITGDWESRMGGLVGSSSGEINDSYATGKVSGPAGRDRGPMGGLVGLNSGTVKRCYSRGEILSSTHTAGAFIGQQEGVSENNFFDREKSGYDDNGPHGEGAAPKTTSEMKDIMTYIDTGSEDLDEAWEIAKFSDFNGEVWMIHESEYPQLGWQHIETFKVTVNIAGGGGEENVGEGTHEFDEGEYLKLKAAPEPGWEFVEWMENGDFYSDMEEIIFRVDSDREMKAVFNEVAQTYELNINITGAGREENYGEGIHAVEEDSEVNLRALSSYGWRFVEWRKEGGYYSSYKDITFTMDEDRFLEAFFEREDYDIYRTKRVVYKNVGNELTASDLNLPVGGSDFSGLTDALPYKVTEDDIGVNDLKINSFGQERTVKVVVTDASRAVDLDGWTVLEPKRDTNIIYVSSSEGDDDKARPYSAGELNSEDPRFPDPEDDIIPYESLSRARSAARDRYPDWILLKRGDTWEADLGYDQYTQRINLTRSGRSVEDSMIVSSYGHGPRPELKYYTIRNRSSYVVISDIRAYGISGGIGHNVLVENCYLSGPDGGSGFHAGRSASDNAHGFELRRNIITENYRLNTSGHIQGVSLCPVYDVLMEENLFDMNGWHIDVEGSATMFNHNAYLRNVDDISLRNNLFMRSSSIHIKMTSSRKGASKNLHYQGNFFFDGEIGFSIGGNNHDPLWRFQDVVIEDNVLSNINLSRPTDRGFAWYIGLSDNKRTLVRNNILAHQTRYGNSYGVSLTDHGSMSDVNIEDNIFYNINRRPIRARGIDNNEYWSDINITRNTIQNYDTDSDTLINHYGVFDPVVEYSSNTYWSSGANWFAVDQNPSWPNKNYEEWVELSGETDSEARDVEFRDPDRDLARYHGHIAGEASYEEFIREAKKQDRYNWSYYYTAMAVNEYFREGFTPVSDIGPPGSVEDGKRELNAQTPEPVEDGKVLLSWRAPGGDGWKTNNIDGYYEVRYATYSVKNSSWSWWNSIENHERDYYSGIEYFKNPENVGYTENRIVEGLYSGATYYFGVRVYNNVEKASNLDYKLSGGEPVYAVAGDTIPYAPENLSVEYNTGEALLEWDRSPSVSVVDYRIYRSDISGVYDKVISTVSANPNSYSYVDDSGGEGYYYAASAIDHNGYESKIVCFDPDEIPPEIQDKTSRSRAYGTRKIRVRVTDDRNVVEVEGKYRPLGSNIKGYELDFFPEPGAGVIYSGVADVDKEKISKEGFEYYITAFDGTNTSEKGWIKIKPPSDIPQKSFITPDNPEFSFGRGVKEVLITDVRGNKVFEKSKGSENIITWDPSDGSTIRIESGIYIYRIKTESGYKYGTVVIAK